MNSTQYFVAASLDGFIATADDDLAWLFEFNGADGQEAAYQRFYDGVGALMMGADTFRFLLSQDLDAWPYPDVPTWVFSHTELPDLTTFTGADIRFVAGDVAPVHRDALLAAGGGGGEEPLVGWRWQPGGAIPRIGSARRDVADSHSDGARRGQALITVEKPNLAAGAFRAHRVWQRNG